MRPNSESQTICDTQKPDSLQCKKLHVIVCNFRRAATSRTATLAQLLVMQYIQQSMLVLLAKLVALPLCKTSMCWSAAPTFDHEEPPM